MAVTNASSPSGKAERTELTGILSEFRAAPEEQIDIGRRTMTPAVRDGARDAR
jgi:hypothetical protein